MRDKIFKFIPILGIITGSYVMGSIVRINLDKAIQDKKIIIFRNKLFFQRLSLSKIISHS